MAYGTPGGARMIMDAFVLSLGSGMHDDWKACIKRIAWRKENDMRLEIRTGATAGVFPSSVIVFRCAGSHGSKPS